MVSANGTTVPNLTDEQEMHSKYLDARCCCLGPIRVVGCGAWQRIADFSGQTQLCSSMDNRDGPQACQVRVKARLQRFEPGFRSDCGFGCRRALREWSAVVALKERVACKEMASPIESGLNISKGCLEI